VPGAGCRGRGQGSEQCDIQCLMGAVSGSWLPRPSPRGAGPCALTSMVKSPVPCPWCLGHHARFPLSLVPRPSSLVPRPSSVPRVGGRHMVCHRGPWDARSADLARGSASRHRGPWDARSADLARGSASRHRGPWDARSADLARCPASCHGGWRFPVLAGCRRRGAGELGDGVFPRHPGSRLDVLSVPGNISPMSCPWPSRSPSGRRGVLTRNRTS
jgi:hypothetical protein